MHDLLECKRRYIADAFRGPDLGTYVRQFTSQQQMDAKKCVQMCQKRFRKDALASVR
jgi:hypothetical protein